MPDEPTLTRGRVVAYAVGMITVICKVCEKPFSVRPYRAKTARFCSYACGGRFRGRACRGRPRPDMLGNKLRAGVRPTNAFQPGHGTGEDNHNWKESVTIACDHCQAEFHVKPWEARKGARFCSRVCFELSGVFVGPNSPCYVGGKNSRRGRNWSAIRLRVVQKQHGKCADCDKLVGNSLPVHHKKPYREFDNAADANRESNLVGLCQPCHMKREYPKAQAWPALELFFCSRR